MKKRFLCVLGLGTVLASTVHARELKNFEELKSAIQNGNNINIVVTLGQCQPAHIESDPIVVTAALKPTAFMIIKNQILTSDLHFTRNNPKYPGVSLYEYVTYRFKNDNQLTLESETLKAINYVPLQKTHEVSCPIGTAARLFSDGLND